ncbi:MAG: glycosyltransferase family 4 protein [Candidatus Woesearchaeota archaeon]
MRILIYFRELKYAGVHTYLINHVKYFIKHGHEIWVTFSKDETRTLFEKLGAKTFCNKELQRHICIYKDLIALWHAYHFCKANKIECIFSHTSKGGVIGRLAGFLSGVPKRIHVIHGFSFNKLTPFYKRIPLHFIERIMAYFATALITVNKSDAELILKSKMCNSNKVHIILNGVKITPKNKLMNEEEKKLFISKNRLNPNHNIILFVGRLDEDKRPLDLIKAFSMIKKENIHLAIIGEGNLFSKCSETILKMKLSKKVSMLGFRRDVDNWYQVCSVYILPSIREGLPLTLLEAMSFGACCIATDIEGSRECIKNGIDGFLVPPKRPDKLYSVLSQILDNQEIRKNIGEAARLKILKEFTVQRMCRETYKVLTN